MGYSNESHPVVNRLLSQVPDNDPEETSEWVESLSGLINKKGDPRAHYILLHMLDKARREGVSLPAEYTAPYVNTIPIEQEPYFPGDETMEHQYHCWVRWGTTVQVARTQRPGVKVDGHISSYASVATLCEVSLNHFFRGKDHPDDGDHMFFQRHAPPDPYAHTFLKGHLNEAEMDGFHQQTSSKHGLPSYPHPRQLPDFWEYPAVSLGLGPAEAIYQTWLDRYLHLCGVKDISQQHAWAFIDGGEMGEPEPHGMLQLAAQQGLDNLTFVINYNLQRLDGPVHGSGKIIQELEAFFKSVDWDVIKVVWGRGWDQLLVSDKDDALANVMNETLDGDYQTFRANDGAYVREHFFGCNPHTKTMVRNWTDEQIWTFQRGGHDHRKVYAAYKAAMKHTGQSAMIPTHTIKGYILGSHFAGRSATHQMKKLTLGDVKQLRDRLQIPISGAELERNPYMPPYYKPVDDDPVLLYIRERREKLGGWVPGRRDERNSKLPPLLTRPFEGLSKGPGSLEVATTMTPVRLLKDLFKGKQLGRYSVPIIPDEARTFGLDATFSSTKIFNTHNQNYTAVDIEMTLSYKESEQGQVIHTGITKADSVATFQVVGATYAAHNLPMVSVCIFYSMLGFQRTGDQFWATGDQLARGSVIGTTAGRMTLAGGGLQHMDGHSPVLASTSRTFVIYDPAYVYEIRYIMEDGLARTYGEDDGRDPNVMYCVIVYDEPIHQPAEPEGVDIESIKRGIHRVKEHLDDDGAKVQLLASGIGVSRTCDTKRMLAEDWGVDTAAWSVTSWSELRRDSLEADEHNLLHPEEAPHTVYFTEKLSGCGGPFIATSDLDILTQDLTRQWVPGEYRALGADGFGISDTRRAARRFYHIDAESLAIHTLQTLADQGRIDRSLVKQAIDHYGLFNCQIAPAGDLPNEGRAHRRLNE